MFHRTRNAPRTPRRAETLRRVVEAVNDRRDGTAPMDLPGVAETFGDETDLVAALQLRWHTRLAGRIDRALMDYPTDREAAVVEAWRRTADDLAGVRAVLDRAAAEPADATMAAVTATARRKEHALLAAMAGLAGAYDPTGPAAGDQLEQRARSGCAA